MSMPRFLLLFLAVCMPAFAGPLTPDILWKLQRVGDPQVSPDGKTVVFSMVSPDMETNTRPSQIYSVAIGGGTPRQLTKEGSSTRPRWSPDGKRIAFLRGGQIWTMAPEGSDARQITKIATDADGHVWSRDGQWFLFASEVYPQCPDEACNAKRSEAAAKSKVKARHTTRLLYRHWSSWKEGKRSHLFVVSASGGAPRDLTPGDYDVPPFSLGGPDDYAFSPDGKEVIYTSNHDEVEAASTNNDLWLVPTAGGAAKRITTNQGSDSSPVYSPDGRWIVYRSQQRAGYEADRVRLILYERASGKHTELTTGYDRSVSSATWSPDSKLLYLGVEDQGTHPVVVLPVSGGTPKALVIGGVNDDISVTADGKTLVFTRASMRRPNEIYSASASGGEARPITRVNDGVLAGVDLPAAEAFWFAGAGGTKVHGWLLKPPAFDATKKYPVLFILHGGPQTGFNDAWSFRWNTQVFAGAGYVVVAINRRGSTGFGQKFTDEINQEWGGRAYEDIMKGVEHVLATYPFTDGTRMGAAGGSYGGFLANWIAGHTGRFKCLVSHAGPFDQRSMYATEELWFPDWEFGGTPWDNPQVYARNSPSQHVKNFKTPTLVIHGELDYRVPYTEGLQMFSALQRMKVPSELLVYPDEGHWILKPQNSRLWYQTVLGWWEKWLKK